MPASAKLFDRLLANSEELASHAICKLCVKSVDGQFFTPRSKMNPLIARLIETQSANSRERETQAAAERSAKNDGSLLAEELADLVRLAAVLSRFGAASADGRQRLFLSRNGMIRHPQDSSKEAEPVALLHDVPNLGGFGGGSGGRNRRQGSTRADH